jgi:hypothetical protein
MMLNWLSAWITSTIQILSHRVSVGSDEDNHVLSITMEIVGGLGTSFPKIAFKGIPNHWFSFAREMTSLVGTKPRIQLSSAMSLFVG